MQKNYLFLLWILAITFLGFKPGNEVTRIDGVCNLLDKKINEGKLTEVQYPGMSKYVMNLTGYKENNEWVMIKGAFNLEEGQMLKYTYYYEKGKIISQTIKRISLMENGRVKETIKGYFSGDKLMRYIKNGKNISLSDKTLDSEKTSMIEYAYGVISELESK
ncbi:MAG TPA: hypothetical protein VD905_04955 [Flavobacteriales bacterium]|nr:hypothetical protein [Flavobacteriales bacterium]